MSSTTKPDPARGVFETLLVVAGAPVEVDAHLCRLTLSLRNLYAAELPAEARELLERAAAELDLGRVRLTVMPGFDGTAWALTAERIDPRHLLKARFDGVQLRSFYLQGGLGSHKWADRSRLPQAGEPAPLLLDDDDDVLEAGSANVFSVLDGVLVTPRLDGRILPGVTRAVAIEIAREEAIEIEERRVSRDELLEADEVFLTGSVRGIQPARSLDRMRIPRGEVARLLGGRLARRHGTSRTLPEALSRSA
jgi:para-aminobenzoate synthetase / 4-amino-4-deoxychorismate lyase